MTVKKSLKLQIKIFAKFVKCENSQVKQKTPSTLQNLKNCNLTVVLKTIVMTVKKSLKLQIKIFAKFVKCENSQVKQKTPSTLQNLKNCNFYPAERFKRKML